MEGFILLIIIYLVYHFFKNPKSKPKSLPQQEYKVLKNNLEVSVSAENFQNSYSCDSWTSEKISISINKDGTRVEEKYNWKWYKRGKWYSKNQSVTIQNITINSGMIYVGEVLKGRYGMNEASLINPKKNIRMTNSNQILDELGYWPRYETISRECRARYLLWLQEGRTKPDIEIGYVFLFFYGLERRLILDGLQGFVDKKERLEIVHEVRRLLEIYGTNNSFKNYANSFLALEWLLFRGDTPFPDYLEVTDKSSLSAVQLLLSRTIYNGEPIPADLALRWFVLASDYRLKTPARRCPNEFKSLFIHKYYKLFPNGMTVKPNKTMLTIGYKAASASLGYFGFNVRGLPDPFVLSAPIKKLLKIVEESTVELDAYSRYVGREECDPLSISARSLLPKALLEDSSAVTQMSDVLKSRLNKILSIAELYSLLGEKLPAQLTKKELEKLAKFINIIGYGISPDPRFYNIKLQLDSNIVIFENQQEDNFFPSTEFHNMINIIRLGVIVAQVDNSFSLSEKEKLENLILENNKMTESEKKSLLAFLLWSINTPQNLIGIKQKLSKMGNFEKSVLGKILVSVAYADGKLDKNEIKQLEKIYTMMGLDKTQLSQELHSSAVSENNLVTVAEKEDSISYSIPANKITQEFSLDMNVINARSKETADVKNILSAIFDNDEQTEQVEKEAIQHSPTQNIFDELDNEHRELFMLLVKQESWTREEVAILCKNLNIMIDGALEVLNDFAFNHAKVGLIEEDERIYIDLDVAKELREHE